MCYELSVVRIASRLDDMLKIALRCEQFLERLLVRFGQTRIARGDLFVLGNDGLVRL
jgi:hypothetical protein